MANKVDKRVPMNYEELLSEVYSETHEKNKNIAGLSKASQQLANTKRKDSNYVPPIDNPYILPEDIEYEFENVYEDFLEDIKTKQDALESIKMKYKKQAQKLEEEEAYNERVRKSKRRVRRDSKGKERLIRTDDPDSVFNGN